MIECLSFDFFEALFHVHNEMEDEVFICLNLMLKMFVFF